MQPDPLGVVTTGTPTATTKLNHLYGYGEQNPLSKTDPFGLCPCQGGQWTQSANVGFSLFVGGGAQFSKAAIFTCRSNPAVQCKANVVCVGGGPMLSGGIGADLFGDVSGVDDSNSFNDWTSAILGSGGPLSVTGSFSGGGTVSLMKSFGAGLAYVSCRAYYVRCNCPCEGR
jgi:hypothetical protein